MKLIKSMFSRQALLPAGLLLVLSALYELAYYGIFSLPLGNGLQLALFILLYLLASLALYALIAGKKGFRDGKALVQVLLLPAALLVVFYGILTPLYMAALSSAWLLVAVELVCALLLIFLGSLVLEWDRAVAEGVKPWARLKRVFTDRQRLNGWCFLLLARILVDTLTGGIYTLAYGVNAFSLLSLTFFQADPLSSAAMYASAGLSGAALLFCIAGCLYAWMTASWLRHGTD